jgi:hypothetical protein
MGVYWGDSAPQCRLSNGFDPMWSSRGAGGDLSNLSNFLNKEREPSRFTAAEHVTLAGVVGVMHRAGWIG